MIISSDLVKIFRHKIADRYDTHDINTKYISYCVPVTVYRYKIQRDMVYTI
jgi:hypothetical protein